MQGPAFLIRIRSECRFALDQRSDSRCGSLPAAWLLRFGCSESFLRAQMVIPQPCGIFVGEVGAQERAAFAPAVTPTKATLRGFLERIEHQYGISPPQLLHSRLWNGGGILMVKRPLARRIGAIVMPGDPKACRENALRCAELASSAGTPELKATLISLSKNWINLAVELERAHALLETDHPTPVIRRKIPA
jgi:hypothetical protein